ncbi:hypothetical protein [Bosea sp. (in: a-proteobacteria)]|uniref:hypothetical protein n=1 Tax=Bosea sp. (in: a-proteobacteria) TaxID=1871050 RepID=UPI0027373624|nr:hypothetical protein [Bosea sp. (in: a-proteobacteria)]MDP3408181.1 hypothetical protein [Bosea sp. (in: a-proteobacteria)]
MTSAETSANATTVAPNQPETRRGVSSARGSILRSVEEADTILNNSDAAEPGVESSRCAALMRRRNGVVKI